MSRGLRLASPALTAVILSFAIVRVGDSAVAQTRIANPSTGATPTAEVMFKLAKGAWHVRTDASYVTFQLRERYTWRNTVHDNWWAGYYRDADHDLVLHRMVVPADEASRLRGFPIGLDLHFHKSPAHVDSFDTSASADAFPVLDPLIEPNSSFGMLAHDALAALVGSATPSAAARTFGSASPAAMPSSEPAPTGYATEKPLHELAHVEAVARDYAIAFVGIDRVGDADAYHLALTPLRDPQTYRLRDLWIDPATYATLELGMQGLFAGKPYDDARWYVSYATIDGRSYIRDIRAGDALRFGMDRNVSGLRFDFVAYDFPVAIPDTTFRRLL